MNTGSPDNPQALPELGTVGLLALGSLPFGRPSESFDS